MAAVRRHGEGAAAGPRDPPHFQVQALEGELARHGVGRQFPEAGPRAPAAFQTRAEAAIEVAGHLRVGREGLVEQQLIHAQARQLDHAVIVAQAGRVAHSRGKAGHEAHHGDGHDGGGHHHLKQRESAPGGHTVHLGATVFVGKLG